MKTTFDFPNDMGDATSQKYDHQFSILWVVRSYPYALAREMRDIISGTLRGHGASPNPKKASLVRYKNKELEGRSESMSTVVFSG
jgi:hypothetical protein